VALGAVFLSGALFIAPVFGAIPAAATAPALIKVLRGEFRKVNWLVYVLTALFIARFLYLAQ
jgi:xanthine/uracil/vitamin C permease (AzgA family)